MLGGLPFWAMKFASTAVRFMEFELRQSVAGGGIHCVQIAVQPHPKVRRTGGRGCGAATANGCTCVQYTAETASSQAKGVLDIRLQNLVLALVSASR